MTFYLLKKDLCPFYHISDYIEYFHCPGHFVCVGNSRKVKYNPCPQCAYIWCVFLCVCVCVLYLCTCMFTVPEGVRVCVSVCLSRAKLRHTVASCSKEHSPQGQSC